MHLRHRQNDEGGGGGSSSSSSSSLNQFPSQHRAASVRPRLVQLAEWCWCFRIDSSHSAVSHTALTMKQACGPNTLPSCFWLLTATVRTSGHMTSPVIDEASGELWSQHPLTASSPFNLPPHCPGPTFLFLCAYKRMLSHSALVLLCFVPAHMQVYWGARTWAQLNSQNTCTNSAYRFAHAWPRCVHTHIYAPSVAGVHTPPWPPTCTRQKKCRVSNA